MDTLNTTKPDSGKRYTLVRYLGEPKLRKLQFDYITDRFSRRRLGNLTAAELSDLANLLLIQAQSALHKATILESDGRRLSDLVAQMSNEATLPPPNGQ
jgi:hypothetical protein